MNSLRNKVQLIGYLGADPEMRTLDNGNMLAKMRVATNDTYRNGQGEKVTDTQWHHVVAWGKTAETAGKFLSKGSEVLVEGRLVHRDFTGSDGQKRYFTEVVANELLFMDKKQPA